MKNKILAIFGVAVIIGLAVWLVLTSVDLDKREERIELLSSELEGSKQEAERLSGELDFAKSENTKLLSDLKEGGAFYERRISELETSLAEKTALSDKLSAEMEKRRLQKGLDFSFVKKTVEDIERYIEGSSPLVRVMLTDEELEKLKSEGEDDIYDHKWVDAEKYIKEAKEKLGEDYDAEMSLGKLLDAGEQEADAPIVAIYYEDLVTGYKYAYNGDLVFDAASVMKAPYIMAVLDAHTEYRNGNIKPDTKDERYSAEKLEEMFDLERTIVLDEENTDVYGSGVLKDMPLGTEVDFSELFTFALKNSDNIAFRLVKKNFTNKWYYDFARKCGVKSPFTYEMNLTVNEAGKLFKELYYFTVQNEEHGEFVREALASSSHTVLSKSVLPNSIHKYGWDENAYHDAAIVYGDRPYVAIVFTDMDSGGAKADTYIREIFKRIAAFHKSLE